ncbi:MAG: GDP-L-fucose synthase [Prochlorococcus marinus CUG1435]|nr:GDP-L-fucose synthase [Prochlorococcus marinus CUG1435]
MNLINKNDLIFVAGHTGMAGNAITKFLKVNGYQNLLLPTRFELDLTDSKAVKEWFCKNKPQVVILAAAKVGGIEANSKFPSDFILENLKIEINIIENSWKFNVKRLLFLGSSCIYPKFAKQPIKEEYLLEGGLEITNESYAVAKIAGIKMCSSLKKQYGFDAISLMPTNLYGPGDNYHPTNSHVMASLISKFFNAKAKNLDKVLCWGSGLPKREFLYVEDLAKAVLFTLEKISSDNKLLYDEDSNYLGFLNVGTGKDISIKELANLIAEEVNFKGNIEWDLLKPDGTPKKLLDVSKLNKLGWFASTEINNGIKSTINNYSDNLNKNKLRSN